VRAALAAGLAMTDHDSNLGPPCRCLECQAAGITDRPIVRVPGDDLVAVPHWLHGEPLRRWWVARDEFLRMVQGLIRPSDIGPDLGRDPGEEG
jgi:hypothetical protein